MWVSCFSTVLSLFPSLTGPRKLTQVRSKMLVDFLLGTNLKTIFPILIHSCCSENSRHLEREKKNSVEYVGRVGNIQKRQFTPPPPALSQGGKIRIHFTVNLLTSLTFSVYRETSTPTCHSQYSDLQKTCVNISTPIFWRAWRLKTLFR